MAKSKKLNITRSNNSVPFWGRDFPLEKFGRKIEVVADTEVTLTVPEEVNVALFSYTPGSNIQVSEGDSSQSLPGGSFSNTSSLLNPTAINVIPGETLRFIAPVESYLFVSFYSNKA